MQTPPATVPLNFFRALRQKRYDQAWKHLSNYSQRVFLETLFKSLKQDSCSLERLQDDFAKGTSWAAHYWDDFAQHLQLDTWLSQQYKEYGASQKQILVLAQPANLYLLVIEEAGDWRFGYFETFLDN